MIPEKENALDFSVFFDSPGHSRFTFGEDLLVRKKHPASGTRDEDEIIGRIREIIVRNFQGNQRDEETDGDGPAPIRCILKLERERGESTDYLLTLFARNRYDDGGVEYRAFVQDISGCLQNIRSASSPVERGSINVQTFRKFLHELSNPLSVISGFTEYMLASMPKDAPNREFVQEIFGNALRLREIIEKASPARRSSRKRKTEAAKNMGAV
jgi:signal transduction histidine kinase